MSIVVNYSHIQAAFESNPDLFQRAVYTAIDSAASGAVDQQDLSTVKAGLLADWNEAIAAFKQEKSTPGTMSTPRNAMASRLQSLLSEKSLATKKLSTEMTGAQGYQVKFDPVDFHFWLTVGWDAIFRPKKAAWVSPSPVPERIDNNAVLALFGDWGTGMYGAPVISKSISAMTRCDYAIHLGDTYYSGTPEEITSQLVGNWPTLAGGRRGRALNGNHDMYSGGQGYFSALKTFFNQSASCFALQNDNWTIVALDTAYENFDIDTAQVEWLNKIVAAAGSRKLILLSHYQPFSYFDPQGKKLQTALANLLDTQRIHAWFWGHEHRLVLYEPHSKWGFKGRCIGHGGFPNFRDALTDPPSPTYVWVNLAKQATGLPAAKVLDGPNPWVTEAPTKYSPHGFVVLEFAGSNAFETYKTPDNVAVTERMAL